MKWLYVTVAFVLGAAITWLLTVRRASRTVPVEGPAEGATPAPPGPDSSEAVDETPGFGGVHTPVSDVLGAAEAWDRDAEDEDALLPGVRGEEDRQSEPRDGGTSPAP